VAPRTEGKAAPQGKAPHTGTAEWIVAALSAALVLAVIGFLIYDGVGSPGTPPDVIVEVDSIQPAGPGYLVLIRATNRGRSTAADLVVVGELGSDTGRVEVSETTIDYVPAGGKQRAGLYFTHDPSRFRLRLRAYGYREP
jgi:uncharacterized protein (TIGR02588 family)